MNTVDWETVAKALLVKYGGLHGHALVGAGTLSWAQEHVELRVEQDGDAVLLRWHAPALKPEGV